MYKTFETIKVEEDKEYFFRPDGKIAFRFRDDTIGYRVDELRPEVMTQLDRARSIYRYPTRPMIDTLVKMQEENPQKAVNYVKYKLLGECGYLDVYGKDIQIDCQRAAADEKIIQLESEVKELTFICKLILQKIDK